MQTFGHFTLEGPNGTHECVVSECLGPSVADIVENRFDGQRLPGRLTKSIMKGVVESLDYMHNRKVVHGDLHIRNLAFTLPSMTGLSEAEFLSYVGQPEIGPVKQANGKECSSTSIPTYLVAPASFPNFPLFPFRGVKIGDFGESFITTEPPSTLRTPLCVRPPEIIFGETPTHLVDLWSLGCLIFELVVGQPLFDSILTTPRILVKQMLETTRDELPVRWQNSWQSISEDSAESNGPALQEWLDEMYFDGERREDLSKSEIRIIGDLIGKLLRLEPTRRMTTAELLRDPWIQGLAAEST
ncbi:hypothetical protein FH972_023966 [Carpinus fangiana]|nr:hypothetical protein FH972_023966 [Carpinus fangiana]